MLLPSIALPMVTRPRLLCHSKRGKRQRQGTAAILDDDHHHHPIEVVLLLLLLSFIVKVMKCRYDDDRARTSSVSKEREREGDLAIRQTNPNNPFVVIVFLVKSFNFL
jgi:hypothetical protein